MIHSIKRRYRIIDYHFGLVILPVLLSAIGVFLIGSAELSVRNRQIAGVAIGILVMVAVSLMDYSMLANLGWTLYIVNIVLLAVVRIAGSVAGGAGRWLEIGGFRFQPSELSKVLMILFFAWFFNKYESNLNKRSFLAISLFLIGLVCLLILGQPDLSTTIVVFWICICILFLSGISFRRILGLFSGFILFGAIALFLVTRPEQQLLSNYQYERIMAWLNPSEWSEEAYQQQNSIMAIGSGGLGGKGLDNSSPLSVKNGGFLPEPHTDFIMAVAGEELGFAGSFIIILLMMLLVTCCIFIGIRAKDQTGKMICGGVAAFLGGQSFINLGVVSGMLPNTGLTMPFVSYGLTSLLTSFLAVGLVLNVGLQKQTRILEKGRTDRRKVIRKKRRLWFEK